MTFDIYNNNQTIADLKEIEITVESMFKQHKIKLDKIIKDNTFICIENSLDNRFLKEVNIRFDLGTRPSELINIYNDRNHKIINIKMKYECINFNDCNKTQDKDFTLNNLIMYIDEIVFKDTCTMEVSLKGHMVV